MTPLKVAVLAPIAWRTPPRHYGPWELFASLLTEGLVVAGADVTLFATGDSVTAAQLCSVVPQGYNEDDTVDAKVAECLHISSLFERADEFDIIHNGFDFLPLTYSTLVSTPVVTTIHGFSSERIVPVYAKYDGRCAYVAISDADRHPQLHYAATVHHGIDTASFTLGAGTGGHLLFFGRIHPDKGAAEAIEVAHRCGLPLVMAGIIQDQEYFDVAVSPHLADGGVHYLGSVGSRERDHLLGDARALLHLVNFDEPFGFSVVEAMACGTPVIASRRGSMPELIDDGRTGFLVADVDEATSAVGRLGEIDRAVVRNDAIDRFSRARMIGDYLAVYEQVLAHPRLTAPPR